MGGRAHTAEEGKKPFSAFWQHFYFCKHELCYFFGDVCEQIRRRAALSGIVVRLTKGPRGKREEIHVFCFFMSHITKDDDYSCLSKWDRFFSPDPMHSRSCFCVRPLPRNMGCSIQFRCRVRNTENGKLPGRGAYLYLKLEPLLKSRAFCIDLGSSGSLKKAWNSTQFFQKHLQTSRLAMENSSVSLQEGWRQIYTV